MLLVERVKLLTTVVNRLRRAQKQPTFRAQTKMKNVEHPSLSGAVEINEQVATRDHVESREGRVLQQVMHGKQQDFPQLAPHAIARVLFDEVALQAIGRDIGRD